MAKETLEFQTEVKKILDLMVNSLYTHRIRVFFGFLERLRCILSTVKISEKNSKVFHFKNEPEIYCSLLKLIFSSFQGLTLKNQNSQSIRPFWLGFCSF